MTKIKLAVYGGAFNPPHPGHESVISQLLDKAERVLVVPSFAHPFGKKMMPFPTRVEWLTRMVNQMGESAITVDTVEEELASIKTPIFSIDLLRFIAQKYGIEGKNIALVMGEDNAKVFPTFYGYKEIMEEFSVITIDETINLHSSMIRSALQESDTIPEHWIPNGMNQSDYEPFRATE
jgi:nicotinate-nucleotide adenylyltransferase